MAWIDPLGLSNCPIVYRGAKKGKKPNFKPKPNEYKIDKNTGLVKNTHGVSVFDNKNSVSDKGFVPHKVKTDTVSDKLKIQQRGQDKKHYEIMPKEPMPLKEYEEELSKIECEG